MMKPIVLASASPRRKEILARTGLPFRVDATDSDEEMDPALSPRALARSLSYRKAASVASRHKNALIIAADTFIVFRGRIFGKPHTAAEAGRMLKTLNGKKHSVITGFTIMDTATKKRLTRSIETKVYFRKMAPGEIDAYVRSREPLDKAGAYAIQGLGAALIRKIEGDYDNVVGLPVSSLVEELKKFGIHVLRPVKKTGAR
jgi:septum formation protein